MKQKQLLLSLVTIGLFTSMQVWAASPYPTAEVDIAIKNNSGVTLSLQQQPAQMVCSTSNCQVTQAPSNNLLKSGSTASFITKSLANNYSDYTVVVTYATSSNSATNPGSTGKVGCTLTVNCSPRFATVNGEKYHYCVNFKATASVYAVGDYDPNWLPSCYPVSVTPANYSTSNYVSSATLTISP